MKITGRLPYWSVLTILGCGGLFLIITPGIFEITFDHGISSGIGTALIVASILGATIDRWMKAEIASDVFRATLGYILPVEFHKAIHDLISFRFMCESHEMWYELTAINDDAVEVRVKIERRLHNITNSPQDIEASLDIDEWGFLQKSIINRCELQDTSRNIIRRVGPSELDDEWVLHAKSESIACLRARKS